MFAKEGITDIRHSSRVVGTPPMIYDGREENICNHSPLIFALGFTSYERNSVLSRLTVFLMANTNMIQQL